MSRRGWWASLSLPLAAAALALSRSPAAPRTNKLVLPSDDAVGCRGGLRLKTDDGTNDLAAGRRALEEYDTGKTFEATCSDSCDYAFDGECDDVSMGGFLCDVGTDCTDCSQSSSCPEHSSPDGPRCACDAGYTVNAQGDGCKRDGSPSPPRGQPIRSSPQISSSGSTATLYLLVPHDWAFAATSGTRYDVELVAGWSLDRLAADSGASAESAACTFREDAYDYCEACKAGPSCEAMISSGEMSCAADLCDTCGLKNHYCDYTCGFRCMPGQLDYPMLHLLPPGATKLSEAVASDTVLISSLFPSDDVRRSISFTAATTGTYTARVTAGRSSAGRSDDAGPVTVTVTAAGTALDDAPQLQVDASSHQLTVRCIGTLCTFGYDGTAVLYGDGTGFDLVLEDAEAGRAYAFLVELPAGEAAAQVEATFYQAGSYYGAAGFEPVVSGPMGEWTATPAGHRSYAEFGGCSNEELSCNGFPTSFGVHAEGASAPRFLSGTWVAPASGPVLLKLALNCRVPFYTDVEVDCHEYNPDCGFNADGASIRLPAGPDDLPGSQCESEMRLTVTPGAYFDPGAGPSTQPISGSIQRTDTIVVTRAKIEEKAAAVWQQANREVGRRLQISACDDPDDPQCHAPSVDEMLDESNTEAHEILLELASVQQQPSVAYPTSFELSSDGGGHRRRMQLGDDQLTVAIDTHAPSVADADRAQQRLIAGIRDHAPSVAEQSGAGGECDQSDLQPRTRAVNMECCDEPSEDCSSGIPATCNAGCAAVVLPFFSDCSDALGAAAAAFDDVVALCHAALPPGAWKGRRRLQCNGSCGCPDGGCHATDICGLGSSADECTALHQVEQETRLTVSRADIEAILRDQFEVGLSAGRRLQADGGSTHAPSLDEALVSGTEANALLASIFIGNQPPLAIEPTSFITDSDLNRDEGGGYGGRRRLQVDGSSCCPEGGCHWDTPSLCVTINTYAATPADAAEGAEAVAKTLGGTLVGGGAGR
jgi:hypothetical protein